MSLVDRYRRLDRRFMQIAAPWIYVLLPGVALHELAHVLVGHRYGDVDIDWTRPVVTVDWNDRVPVWGVFGYFLAPLIVGGLTAFVMPLLLPLTPGTIDIWLVANLLLLAGPSALDVRSLVLVLSGG